MEARGSLGTCEDGTGRAGGQSVAVEVKAGEQRQEGC